MDIKDILSKLSRADHSGSIWVGKNYSLRELVNDLQAVSALSENGGREAENVMRRLLWMMHGADHVLYGDDGEMQCSKCMIDFKRMSAQDIERKFWEIGNKAIVSHPVAYKIEKEEEVCGWCIVCYVGASPFYYDGSYIESKPSMTGDFSRAMVCATKQNAKEVLERIGGMNRFAVEQHMGFNPLLPQGKKKV